MKVKCADCQNLNKSRKQTYNKAYRYGCNLREDGYMSTWINTDRLLLEISCSDEEETEIDDQLPGQMSIMDFIS